MDTNLFFVFPLTVVCAFSKMQHTRNMNLALFKTIHFLQNSYVALDVNSVWGKKGWEVDFCDTGDYYFVFINYEKILIASCLGNTVTLREHSARLFRNSRSLRQRTACRGRKTSSMSNAVRQAHNEVPRGTGVYVFL